MTKRRVHPAIPQHSKISAKSQDAAKFLPGGRGIEPVQRLTHYEQIYTLIGQASGFGATGDALESGCVGEGLLGPGAHGRIRLDSIHFLYPAYEVPGEDAGAGANIGHDGVHIDVGVLQDGVNRLGGVIPAVARVLRGAVCIT